MFYFTCDRSFTVAGRKPASVSMPIVIYRLTRNTSDCDQSNYSSRIVFPSYLLNLAKPEIALFDSPTPKIESENQTRSKSESDDPWFPSVSMSFGYSW